jgi:hypothetical protein
MRPYLACFPSQIVHTCERITSIIATTVKITAEIAPLRSFNSTGETMGLTSYCAVQDRTALHHQHQVPPTWSNGARRLLSTPSPSRARQSKAKGQTKSKGNRRRRAKRSKAKQSRGKSGRRAGTERGRGKKAKQKSSKISLTNCVHNCSVTTTTITSLKTQTPSPITHRSQLSTCSLSPHSNLSPLPHLCFQYLHSSDSTIGPRRFLL